MSDVLIVDDSPTERARFRHLLLEAGFRVHEAASGAEAVAQASSQRPHVIVLDVELPDTSGLVVCQALRADPMIAGIPVLMLTTADHIETVVSSLEAGADDYVAKDAEPEVVVARIHRLARYRQMAVTSLLNEQLAQIGRLLAGIVHEIRGPLGVIRGNAELLAMKLEADHPVRPNIEPILRNAQLLQLRLEHLMATVRNGPPVFGPVEIGPLAVEAVDYFRKGSDPRQGRIDVVVEHQGALPAVRADAGRLIQVLLNMMTNAREAILARQSTGRVTVRIQRGPEPAEGGLNAPKRDASPASVTAAPAPTDTAAERPGNGAGATRRDGVLIEVADTGPGIPPEVIERIFEPFFTTKAGGTGYGLYLAVEILREHGGRLVVNNPPEGGARFRLWLPALPESEPKTE